MTQQPRWWAIRRAHNTSASVYTCPLCRQPLPAALDHMLLKPENDGSRRRHAHSECVVAARSDGRLPTFDEWRAAQPRQPSFLRRMWATMRRRSTGE